MWKLSTKRRSKGSRRTTRMRRKMREDWTSWTIPFGWKQMGKVPLLTREQEVEICKRIEDAEISQRKIVYSMGFAGKEHIALAEKLIAEPPKERFDRVILDKKIDSRDKHLKYLRRLVKQYANRINWSTRNMPCGKNQVQPKKPRTSTKRNFSRQTKSSRACLPNSTTSKRSSRR